MKTVVKTNSISAKKYRIQPLGKDVLNITNKVRSNLFTWRGQFSPQLIEALISEYAPQDSIILDPFVGSGTVLYEAGLLGMEAFGAELNPAAAKMAQIYSCINKTIEQRETILKKINEILLAEFPINLPVLGIRNISSKLWKEKLKSIYLDLQDNDSKKIIESLIIICDFHNSNFDSSYLHSRWENLRKIVRDLPYSTKPIKVKICDARRLPLENNIVDFVITSPPYINVFNYHQQYRASAEALGWDLLDVAKSEIGSNRKHRQNRFLTVVQYCLDMFDVLKELIRVCKPQAQIILIVGRESNVKKTSFMNSKIVKDVATKCLGLNVILTQERVFTNKFGRRIFEDILHFVNLPESQIINDTSPYEIGKQFLKAARIQAPSESLSDLDIAIKNADEVLPSRIFVPPLGFL